jgi:hypothetical protein
MNTEMNFTQRNLTRGQLFAEKLLGNQTFIWNGNEYLCEPNTFTYENNAGIGGNPILKDGKLRVRICLFDGGSLPQSQQLVSFRGINYKIARVRTDPSYTFIVLELESDSRHNA